MYKTFLIPLKSLHPMIGIKCLISNIKSDLALQSQDWGDCKTDLESTHITAFEIANPNSKT